MHAPYIKTLRDYKKTIAHKNAALKQQQYDILPTYNTTLTCLGIEIMKMREEVCLFFKDKIQALFSHIFETEQNTANVIMKYTPNWKKLEYETIMSTLFSHMEQEKKMQFCVSGPHRDRITFSLSGYPFKENASTGQIRLLSLLIRAIQAEYYHMCTGKHMVYLFDDVLLELDASRRAVFLQNLPKATQYFFTFLPNEKLPVSFFSKARVYKVENGIITAQ